MKKKIYVCCGTGIATSTVIVKKVSEILGEHQIPFEISQGIISDVKSKVENVKPDLVISSSVITEELGVPVVVGSSFLTGINTQKTIDMILSILTEK